MPLPEDCYRHLDLLFDGLTASRGSNVADTFCSLGCNRLTFFLGETIGLVASNYLLMVSPFVVQRLSRAYLWLH
jgi:hypothetical protein